MEERNSLLKWVAIPVVLFLVLILNFNAFSTKDPPAKKRKPRADMVVIDGLKSFSALERTAVIFLHDVHTNALEKDNKSCNACHLQEKSDRDYLSLKFKRLKDTSKKEGMDTYHAECIGCHRETSAAGKTAGPIETCNNCHIKKTAWISSRQSIAFDKSLHFRHTEANKDEKTNKGDCATCHHEYDEKTKKLFYAREKEGSCRYCHKKATEENRISMQQASHLDCLDCHRKKASQKITAGPVKCAGCHDPEMQKKIERLDIVPRMERKQPDVVLVRSNQKGAERNQTAARTSLVAFDHRAHETYNNTCKVCHHESLQSCAQCHTSKGAKEGKFFKLESAMHLSTSDQSCIGCHETNQRKPECAACHTFMAKNRKPDPATCRTCHMDPQTFDLTVAGLDEEQIAGMLLNARKVTTATYSDEDIPEKVVIKELSDQYDSVELPHRKIIRALLNNIKDNKLASYYHADKGTICQSCHHNSPETKKPPLCGSCHGQPFDERQVSRPGLKGAYHQQCMGCHQVLNLEKPTATGCTDCHKEKKT